jgi:hypothetical protein
VFNEFCTHRRKLGFGVDDEETLVTHELKSFVDFFSTRK